MSEKRRSPGRPPADESAGRLDGIIDAARHLFAERGLDATTLSAVAAGADISLAALYHYVDSKLALYEMVYVATLEATWNAIGKRFEELMPGSLLADRVTALVAAIQSAAIPVDSNTFLAAAPIELRRHQELSPLLGARNAHRRAVLEAVVEPVFEHGALRPLGTAHHATTAFELIFAGWSIEAFIQTDRTEEMTKALVDLAALIDSASPPRPRRPPRPSDH